MLPYKRDISKKISGHLKRIKVKSLLLPLTNDTAACGISRRMAAESRWRFLHPDKCAAGPRDFPCGVYGWHCFPNGCLEF